MKFSTRVSCIGLLAMTAAMLPFSPSFAATIPAITAAKEQDLSGMLKQAMPAVVNVAVHGEITNPINPFARDRQQQQPNQIPSKRFESFGSGVIVDAKRGYILTNAHVIHDAKIITITLSDGRVYHAKLIGEDVASDIAVLEIKADNLTALHLGNSRPTFAAAASLASPVAPWNRGANALCSSDAM